MEREKESLTLSELFGEFTQELRTIVVDEVDLAKVEISRRLSDSLEDGAYLGAGAFLMYAGFLVLVAAFLILLSYIFPLWLAALVAAVVTVGIGYIFFQKGISDLKHRDLALIETIQSLKEDREWLKHRIR